MATLSNADTVPMTAVPQSQAAFDEARRSYLVEQEKHGFISQTNPEADARKAYDDEMAKGGAIKRQPYESTGTGATIGATVGAVGMGLAAKGMPTAAAVGGVVGGVVGEAAEQLLYGGDIKPMESVAGFAEQGALGIAAEGGGQVLRVLKPLKYVQPTALNVEQATRKAVLDKHGIPYLPHDITDSGLHKLLADIGESGIINPNVYKEMEHNKNDLRKLTMVSLADQVGQHIPPDQLALNTVKVVHDAEDAMRGGINTMYTTVREELKYETQTKMVPTGKMIPSKSGLVGAGTEVPEMVKEEKIIGGVWADVNETKKAFREVKLSNGVDTFDSVAAYEDAAKHSGQTWMLESPWYKTVSTVDKLPEFLQWNDAHSLLKETRAEIRRTQDAAKFGNDTAKKADVGALTKIEAILEKNLDTALRNSPEPKHKLALTVWETAQKETKAMSQDYRNETILNFVKATEKHGGEKAMKQFVMTLTPEDTLKVMNATRSEPAVQDSLKRSFLEFGIERAGGRPGNEAAFNPKAARNYFFGKDEFTARKTDLLIPKANQRQIGEFLDVTEQQIDAGKQGKTGTIFMAMKGSQIVIGGAAGLWGGKAIMEGDLGEGAATLGGAVAFTLGPQWIANALQKPRVANLLIQGIRYSASKTKVGQVVQQLARIDETFARAMQTAVNVSGVMPPPPVEKAPGDLTQLPTAFPMEK